MKLLTKSLLKVAEKFPIGSQDGLREDALVLVKLFDPCGRYTLYVTEIDDYEDGDRQVYGYCVSPLGPDCDEWGYASMNEISGTRNRFGLGIERDKFVKPLSRTVRSFVRA